MPTYYSNPISMLSLGRTIDWKKKQIKRISNNALQYTFDSFNKVCPICNYPETSHTVTIYGFDYHICHECNHIFHINNLSQELISKIYEPQSDYLDFYNDINLFNQRIDNISTPRVEFVVKILFNNDNEKIKTSTWIDLGCGGGASSCGCPAAWF